MGCSQPGQLQRSEQLWSPEMPGAISQEAPTLDLEELEYLIHEASNEARRLKGIRSLVWSDTIAYVARGHSLDMAKHGYFGHVNKEGNSATERAAEAGLARLHRAGNMVLEGLGENLFATHRYSEYTVHAADEVRSYDVSWKTVEDIAAEAVTAWLDSPGHRVNLLSPTYRREGIGVALGTNGTLFVTQNLY
ncbi:MAG: CAP domain-containing protein [Bacteroidota bacterium]